MQKLTEYNQTGIGTLKGRSTGPGELATADPDCASVCDVKLHQKR